MAKTNSAPNAQLIKAYEFTPNPCPPNPALWNAASKTFTPQMLNRNNAQDVGVHVDEYLYSITAAVEAGVVEKNGWVRQLFANKALFEEFLDAFVDDYDNLYRLPDRVVAALAALADGANEEDTLTAASLAYVLREEAEATKQL